MQKKIIASLLLAAVAALSLAGCGGETDTPAASSKTIANVSDTASETESAADSAASSNAESSPAVNTSSHAVAAQTSSIQQVGNNKASSKLQTNTSSVNSSKTSSRPVVSRITGPGKKGYNSVIVDISTYFNSKGISFDSNRAAGNYDKLEKDGVACYPGDEMKENITCEGVDYKIKVAASGNDYISCKKQTVNLSAPATGEYIGLLATAACGAKDVEVVLTYTDGTTDTIPLYVSDWCENDADYVAATYTHKHHYNLDTKKWEDRGGGAPYIPYMHMYKLMIKEGKTVKSITLPDQPLMGVFGMSVAVPK